MKIYHVLPKSKLGGAETAVFSSVAYLNKKGEGFKVITIEKSNDYSHINSDFLIRLDGSIFNPICYFRFIKLIIKTKPDMIVFSLWKSSLFGLALKLFFFFTKRKIKTSLIIHSSKFSHWMDLLVTKIGVKVFDNIYFDSLSTQKSFSKKNNEQDMVLSFSTRQVSPKQFESLEHVIKFVFVGRLHKVKNVTTSINFIKFLTDAGINIKYDIFGPDEGELENINNRIAKLKLNGIVCYKGVLDNNDVIDTIKKYNFYIQFSEYEGMAMSVVESMKAGLVPCVTSVGEIPNYSKDGFNAIHFDARYIHDSFYLKDMAMKLKGVIEDGALYENLSNNSSNTFLESKGYKEDYFDKIILRNK